MRFWRCAWGFAQETLTDGYDATVRDRALFRDGVGLQIPSRRMQLRNYQLPTGICLCIHHFPDSNTRE